MYGLAQQKPVAFANVFTYGEKQGITTGNWVDINQRDDGSIIARPYSSNFFRIGSNQTIPIYFGSNLKGLESTVFGSGGDGTWYTSSKGIASIMGDSIQLQFPIDESSIMAHVKGKGVLMLSNAYNNPKAIWFDGKTKTSIPLPPGERWDSVGVAYDCYTGLPCLLQATFQPSFAVYRFDTDKLKFEFLARYPAKNPYGLSYIFGSDSIWINTMTESISLNPNGRKRNIQEYHVILTNKGSVAFDYKVATQLYQFFYNKNPETFYFDNTQRVSALRRDEFYNSYYVGTFMQLQRVFPHIRYYPNLYQGNNSLSTHTLMQTEDGTVYAGSYNGMLSAIYNDKITSIDIQNDPILPGGLGIGSQLFFFTEKNSGLYRLQKGKSKQLLNKGIPGYYIIQSRNEDYVYAGLSGQYAFGISKTSDVLQGKPNWKMVDSSKGMRLLNVVTITEDKKGRIWFGRNSEGWGVYYPDSDTAFTFLMKENQTNFGSGSSICDKYGTVWMAGNKGLWYVDANKSGNISNEDANRLEHPLLRNGVFINSMKIWGKYLLLGAEKNVLLIDLEKFHQKQVINVRYFNPQELNFTADVEQNAMLVDKRDSSLWVATSDNVYQIDLQKWLALPTYTTTPTLQIIAGADTLKSKDATTTVLPANSNSMQMQVQYQSKDNMPRYMQMALVAMGDSIIWSEASVESSFTATNKQNGAYTFYVKLLEQDGTMSVFTFPINIKKFLWQQWWFWMLLSVLVASIAFYIFSLHKKKQLAEANAKRITAEAEALRSEQNRQLTTMQVKSLSNQFRPHFILNALNTIGAQLYDKPEVDEVLGQLGDSIGIIFKNAQDGKISHAMQQEWKLVESVTNIKQMEYKHSVQIHWPDTNILESIKEVQVPMGILQIPIENALIHGLRNKEYGSKDLWITMSENESGIECTIIDNGIGRKAATAMSNHRSNGVGSLNLQAIITMLNKHNEMPILYTISDSVVDGAGTSISITIPKSYSYAI